MLLARDLPLRMRKSFIWFVLFGVRLLFGVPAYARDLFHMACGKHKAILKEYKGHVTPQTSYARAVVIALYPSENTLPFTINLMKGFAESGFFVLGVSTKTLSPLMAEQLLPHYNHIIERFNIGYDFASYQMGIRWLEQNQALKNIDTLAIANDSLFYASAIASTIKELLDSKGEWLGLFESFDGGLHVQSFFEIFRGNVVKSAAFQNFWKTYKPFSSRAYAINRGEHGLSFALRKAGFKSTIACSDHNIKQRLVALLSVQEKASELSKYLAIIKVNKQYLFDVAYIRTHMDQLPTVIEKIAQTTNPTQSLGLLCHFLFGMPIKCDLCYRGAATTEDVVTLAQGFSPYELDAMKAHLASKGTMPPFPSWQHLKTASGVV